MFDSPLGELLGSVLAGLLAATTLAVSSTPPEAPQRAPDPDPDRPVLGRDVSWPNCPRGMGIPARRSPGLPLPPPSTTFVVIGLTNGPAFHPNPCLRAQVAYARRHGMWSAAYAVATYPTPAQLRRYGGHGPRSAATRRDRLWNTGWAQARQNLDVMRAAELRSPIVWVDVEPVTPPAPWSGRPRDNRAVLEGSLAAYRRAGLRVGLYSTPTMWRGIVGDASYGLPEWRTAGLSTRRAAMAACGPARRFQSGAPVLSQWYTETADFNLLCPGRPQGEVLREFFAAN
jgi:hypothetical protein